MAEERNDVLQDLFLREKPAKILMGLKASKDEIYATKLSKGADCTYSHTIKILGMFQRAGMVKFEKTGRIKKVALTDDGWDIAHNLEAAMKKLSQIEENLRKAAEKAPRKEAKPKAEAAQK